MSSGTTTTGGASRGNFHKARALSAAAARFNTGIRIAIFGELSHHSRGCRNGDCRCTVTSLEVELDIRLGYVQFAELHHYVVAVIFRQLFGTRWSVTLFRHHHHVGFIGRLGRGANGRNRQPPLAGAISFGAVCGAGDRWKLPKLPAVPPDDPSLMDCEDLP